MESERELTKNQKLEIIQLKEQESILTNTLTDKTQFFVNDQVRTQKENEQYKNTIKELTTSLETNEMILKDAKNQVKALNRENERLVQNINNLRLENTSNAESHKRTLETKQRRIESYEKLEEECSSLRTKLQAIRKEKEDLQKEKNRSDAIHLKELKQLHEKVNEYEAELKDFRQKSLIPHSMNEFAEGKTVLMNLVNKYEDAQRQLQAQKAENRQLNTYLEAILKEIQSKAPVIQLQKQHFQKTKFEKIKLTQLTKKTIQYSEKLKEENHQLQLSVQALTKETDLLREQVSTLLKEKESNSENTTMSENDGDNQPMETSDSNNNESIFKNIDELLTVNQNLQNELIGLRLYKNEGYDLLYKKSLETIQKLQKANDLQIEKCKRLEMEKERYINLYDSQRSIASSVPPENEISSTKESNDEVNMDTTTIDANEEFGKYKKHSEEIIQNYKNQLESYMAEYSIEKFVTLESNISTLQDRNKSIMEQTEMLQREIDSKKEIDEKQRKIISQYEEQALKNSQEIQLCKQNESKAKNQLDIVQRELDSFKKHCERLKTDLDNIREDNEVLRTLSTSLQVHCKSEREAFERKSNRLIEAHKQTRQELLQLQTLSDKEYQSHKQALISFQEQITTSQNELKESKKELEDIKRQLQSKELQNEHLQQQYEHLQTYTTEMKQQMQQISRSIKFGEDNSTQIIEDANSKLAQANSKIQIQQNTIESMKEEKISYQQTISDLKQVIESIETEKESLSKCIKELEEQKKELEENTSMEIDQQSESSNNAVDENTLQETLSVCANQSKQIEELRKENSELKSQIIASQEKYEQRFNLYALDVEAHSNTKLQLEEVTQEKEQISNQLKELQVKYDETLYSLENQLESAKSRVNELTNENSSLVSKLDQLISKSIEKDKENQHESSSLFSESSVNDNMDSDNTIGELKEVLAYREREKNRLILAYEDVLNEKESLESKQKQLLNEIQSLNESKKAYTDFNDWKSKYEEQSNKLKELEQANACLEDSNKTLREKLKKNLEVWKKSIAESKKKTAAIQAKLDVEAKKQTDNTLITQTNNLLSEQADNLKKTIATNKEEITKLRSELKQAKEATEQAKNAAEQAKKLEAKYKTVAAKFKKKFELLQSKASAKTPVVEKPVATPTTPVTPIVAPQPESETTPVPTTQTSQETEITEDDNIRESTDVGETMSDIQQEEEIVENTDGNEPDESKELQDEDITMEDTNTINDGDIEEQEKETEDIIDEIEDTIENNVEEHEEEEEDGETEEEITETSTTQTKELEKPKDSTPTIVPIVFPKEAETPKVTGKRKERPPSAEPNKKKARVRTPSQTIKKIIAPQQPAQRKPTGKANRGKGKK